MALSLPTTSNTTGSWSNAAVSNTLTNTFWTRDSKFEYDGTHATPAGRFESAGRDIAISANGDYAIVGNKAHARNGAEKGFPYIIARSGNTWTQQASLSNQSPYELSGNRASLGENKYGYAGDGSYRNYHGIDIDDAGDTVVVNGKNYNQNNYAARVEVWERSGNTWSFSAGIDGLSEERLAWEGIRIAPDGLSFVTRNGNGRSTRFEKIAGTWTRDSNHSNVSFGENVVCNNSKFAGVTTSTILTKYWDGSSWISTSSVSYASVITTLNYGSYGANWQLNGSAMSSDGNYLFINAGSYTLNEASIIIYQWDASTNNWVYSTTLPALTAGGWRAVTRVSVNSDATKMLVTGASATNWYSYERSGSTWTKKDFSRTYSTGAIALSDDGLHALQGNAGSNEVEYFEPTGVIASAISNGSVVAHQGRRFRWNAGKNRWTPANKVNLTGVTTSRSRSAGVASSSLSGETLSINGLTVDVGEFAGKTTTYANASIFPFSSLQAGDQAIALDTGYLYVTDGSGWFRVANSAIVT